MNQRHEDRRTCDRREHDQNVARLVDGIAHMLMGCGQARAALAELRKLNGLPVLRMIEDMQSICTSIEAAADAARGLNHQDRAPEG